MGDTAINYELPYWELPRDAFTTDIEKSAGNEAHLMNDTVKNFLWQDVTVTVKDHKTKQPKAILQAVDGLVHAGISSPSSIQHSRLTGGQVKYAL